MREFFFQSEQDQPHPARARAILKAHPEVRQLMERNPYTGLIAFSVVALPTSVATIAEMTSVASIISVSTVARADAVVSVGGEHHGGRLWLLIFLVLGLYGDVVSG